MNAEQIAAYANLYQLLAETLVTPPEWMCDSGGGWPLCAAVSKIAEYENDPDFHKSGMELSSVPAESIDQRRARYTRLFFGEGHPHLHLHESLARDGRLAGPAAFALDAIYKAAGLTVAAAELPDHASMELSFLAFLFDKESNDSPRAAQWHEARRLFVQRHAGRWLPALGNTLASVGDAVYAPVGRLLASALRKELQPRQQRHEVSTSARGRRNLPVLNQKTACTLCGFCVQVCPARAVTLVETDTETRLLTNDQRCIGCGRCVRTCTPAALQLEFLPVEQRERLLRESPRSHCRICDEPTVSVAELEAIAARIGAPAWLYLCNDCRQLSWEVTP